ncbi:hypothetical protein R1flu_010898 [Riccia fluitans]|uniref:Uncharacterized protein n=1 Tax=Riccia fluitans TaxID=41844 RepID=A0ABD1Z6A4_9MARC
MNAEVNNLQGWKISPECGEIIGMYMEDGWPGDYAGALEAASDYLKTVVVRGDGLDVVVFGVDETALSNMDFYRHHNYGDAKVGIIFLSGRPESQREVTAENLIAAGFDQGWEELILRTPEENALTKRVQVAT